MSSDNDTKQKNEAPSEQQDVKILSSTVVTAQGGVLHRVQHTSTSTQTDMIFAIFLPSIHAIGANQGAFPAICTYFCIRHVYVLVVVLWVLCMRLQQTLAVHVGSLDHQHMIVCVVAVSIVLTILFLFLLHRLLWKNSFECNPFYCDLFIFFHILIPIIFADMSTCGYHVYIYI
jgi:hypothetical protein